MSVAKAIDADNGSMRARVGFKKADTAHKAKRDEAKRARKLALIQRKHGVSR